MKQFSRTKRNGGKAALFWICLLLCLSFGLPWAKSASLKKARVTQIIKDVKLLAGQAARPAAVSDEVAEGAAVRTGVESRAELTFTDLTITRLGANTIFSFNEGAREVDLGSGALLVSVPRDGAPVRVRTAAVTAAISGGTALIDSHKDLPTKLFVLEGNGKVCSKTNPNECQTAGGGEMILVTPDGQIMAPVKFNAALLFKTSALIADFPPLPNADLIMAVIEEQQTTQANSSGQASSSNSSSAMGFSNLINVISQTVAALPPLGGPPSLPPPGLTTATYGGAAAGNWSDPASWSPAVVPNNNSSSGQTFNAVMPSGTLTQDIAGGVTIEQLQMNGGVLTLANPLTLNAGLQFTGGTINEGPLSILGPSTQSAPMIVSSVTINNSGNYDVTFDGKAIFNGNGTFNNSGTFTKTTGPGTDSVDIFLNNSGAVRVQNGTLAIAGGGSSSGTFNAAAGAQIQFVNGYVFTNGTRFIGAGSIFFADFVTLTLGGAITNNSQVLSHAEMSLNGDMTWSGSGTLTLANGAQIDGTGTFTNASTINGAGAIGSGVIGIINASGALIDANVSGQTLDVNPSAAGGLNNAGTMRASNGGILVLEGSGGGAFSNTGTIEAITGGSLVFGGAVTSSGIVDLGSSTLNITGSYTQTAGTFRMRGGTVTSTSTLDFQGGVLDAHGTINGNISNAATLEPALGGNGLTVNGNLTLLGSSHLSFQLGGVTQGSQYSFLNVNGTVALSGNLVVSFANGFQNSVTNADSFTLLTSTSNFSGSFSNVVSGSRLLTSDSSGSFLVTYSGNTLILSDFTSGTSLVTSVVFNGAANGLWSDPAVWTPMIVPNNNGSNLFNASMSSGMLTLDISGGVTIERFTMSGGTLALNNPLTLNAGFDYTGGTINNGTLFVAGTSTQSAPLTGNNFFINNSGDYELAFDSSNAFVGTVTFTNSGTVTKSTGPGTVTFNATLNNTSGTMLAQNGTLRFTSGGLQSGTFSADAGATIQFSSNFSFGTGTNFTGAGTILFDNGTSTNVSGTITNNGNLFVNSTGSFTDLVLNGDTTFAGSGTIRLVNAARIRGNGILTNSNTIEGETSNSGSLGADQIGIVNQSSGVVDANVSGLALVVDPGGSGFTNLGTLQASNGGTLLLTGNGSGGFNNTGGTIIALAGSDVQLTNNVVITGGILDTAGTGVVRTAGTATLSSLTNAGTFIVNNGSTTFLTGTINNTDTILVQSAGSFTDLVLNGDVTLTGSGVVTLQNAARIRGNGLLTNTSTIQGESSNSGSIGADQIAILNDVGGLIDANVSGLPLVVDPGATGLTNNGLMRASNGGILFLTGNGAGAFNNNSTISALNGSEVQLGNSAVINGGTFTTAGTGVVRSVNNATLNSLTNAGTFIANNGTNTFLSGTITNTGSMLVQSTGSFTDFILNSDTTLTGSGVLTLQNAARIRGTGVFTNASTIQGETNNSGSIGADQIAIVNAATGVIDANVSGLPLVVDPGAAGLTNNGLMRASNGGILFLTGNGAGIFTNNNLVTALNGSEVQLGNSAVINGGTFTTAGTGVVRNVNNATLNSLTNAGTFIANNGTNTFLSGTITNTGSMLVQSTGSFTDFILNSDTTLTGSGVLTLQNAARIRGTGVFTNASTIQGETSNSGSIGADQIAIVNAATGLIDANVSGLALVVDPGATGLTNNGLMRASNGGILFLTGNGAGAFNNNSTISALNGSEVQLGNSAVINGGTFTTAGSGVVRNVNNATLNSLTNAGTFIANNGTNTFLSGTITNTGSMLVQSTGSFTDFILNSDTTLTGSGVLTLQNAARIRGTGVFTNASTIQGETNNSGSIGADQIAIVNAATGLIDANVSGLALVVDPGAAGLTNNGLMRASNGGILLLTGNGAGIFTNNNLVTALNGSEVQLTAGATITGGTWSTAGTGVIRNLNTASLSNLSNTGSFIANNGTTTFISGTINNTGTMLINSAGSFTDLVLNSDTTLTGSGVLTLQNADRVRGTGILTNASTIQGETSNSGCLGCDQIGIVNQNLIDANVSGLTLVVDPNSANGLQNDGGLLRASNGGILLLTGNGGGAFANINNAGLQAINGGVINLTGTLTSTAGSQLALNNGTFLDNGSADVFKVIGTAGTITVASGATFAAPGGFRFDGVNGSAGGTLDFTAPSVTFGPGATDIGGASFNGGDAATSSSAGGDGGTLNVTATTGDINVNAVIEASTGANGGSVLTGGAGGTVNLTANAGAVNVNARVQVSHNSGSRKSAKGGNINITSGKTTGIAVNIGSSGQLLSLLNAAAPGPGGKIIITASAPNSSSSIDVRGTVQADRGAVDIRNAGDNGSINLSNATLSADILKTAVLGTNGTLNIGGGTLTADTVLKLYATGSNGTINFIADVSLNGNSSKIIAANTVKIFDNVTVTVNGPSAASVYTNNAKYSATFGGDGSTTGTFAGKGATAPQPFANAPALGAVGGP
jgi:hypothetical protein